MENVSLSTFANIILFTYFILLYYWNSINLPLMRNPSPASRSNAISCMFTCSSNICIVVFRLGLFKLFAYLSRTCPNSPSDSLLLCVCQAADWYLICGASFFLAQFLCFKTGLGEILSWAWSQGKTDSAININEVVNDLIQARVYKHVFEPWKSVFVLVRFYINCHN